MSQPNHRSCCSASDRFLETLLEFLEKLLGSTCKFILTSGTRVLILVFLQQSWISCNDPGKVRQPLAIVVLVVVRLLTFRLAVALALSWQF